MHLTSHTINNPVDVAIVSSIVLLLGLISMYFIPAQLLPTIEKPIITITNNWPGASPSEIESEITVPVEETLVGMPHMTNLESWNMANFGFMQLEFAIDTDMTRAMIEVINRLNRLNPLPANAEKPQIMMGEWGDSKDTLIEYFIQQKAGTESKIAENSKYLRKIIVPELQNLYGISKVSYSDGQNSTGDSLQITFDPYRAATLGIDIAKVTQQIRHFTDVSSGYLDIGRRQYIMRFEGRSDFQQLSEMTLGWQNGKPVKISDFADLKIGTGRENGFIYQNGQQSFRLSIGKTNDANVLKALEAVKDKIESLNAGDFAERGLHAQHSFDPSQYIKRSMGLVGVNLLLGVCLAIGVLWLFLRQWRATFLIAFAIPISLLATFIVLYLAGRSLNIISLAGLALTTGMVLDAAIVVLENIIRLREAGTKAKKASYKAATQVWGALLASTITTVAIFIPIMFLDDAEGQMFADLALTIAIGVSVSLLVAITILPSAARYWLRELPVPVEQDSNWDKLADWLMMLTNNQTKRLFWVFGLITFSISVSVLFWPSSNYLPPLKRDTVDSFLFFPPGTNTNNANKEMVKLIDERLQPHLQGYKQPEISDYFFWSFPGASGGWLAINGTEDTDLEILQSTIQNNIIADIPDLFGFSMRRRLFGGFSDSNSVEMQITSADLQVTKEIAMEGMQMVMAQIPGATANPQPDPFADSTKLRFIPNDRRLAEVGWSRQDLAIVVMELGQGAWIGEYYNGEEHLDIFVASVALKTTESMQSIPVVTPRGGIVRLGELAIISQFDAPRTIIRINQQRGYSLVVNPPEGMSLEELVNNIKTKIEPVLMAKLPADGAIKYAGGPEDLSRAINTLSINFLMAFSLLFLIIAILFKSIKTSLLIIITIPLAAVGGVLMVNLMNLIKFQPLDLLGMIGFIILLGLVVNNAILLVAQTRRTEALGYSRQEAVHRALRFRLRPIFMSTLTSLLGMLPLMLFPGTGSGIYRGMAAAIVGGMSVSTIFTLVLLPSLLQLFSKPRKETVILQGADT
ncbi:MAG: efflux RND transporter permease subunit [Gammaproteobacteria bacterium]|nr:efflux RND transporter permease subunit [Gammaproteobacteria bacterium]